MYDMIIGWMYTLCEEINEVVPEMAWYIISCVVIAGIFGWIWHEAKDIEK